MAEECGEIPAELRADLDALRPILERHGIVQYRQGPDRLGAYRLRFRVFNSAAGFTQHRSFGLGNDPVIAEAVSALVRHWQDEYAAGQKADETGPEPSKPQTRSDDLARETVVLLAGGGRRRQEQIGAWFDKALEDPAEILRFTLTNKFPAPRKAGRPPKKRLW